MIIYSHSVDTKTGEVRHGKRYVAAGYKALHKDGVQDEESIFAQLASEFPTPCSGPTLTLSFLQAVVGQDASDAQQETGGDHR